jgi:hypothetical protein
MLLATTPDVLGERGKTEAAVSAKDEPTPKSRASMLVIVAVVKKS